MDAVGQAQVEQDKIVLPAGKQAFGVLERAGDLEGDLQIAGFTHRMLDQHRIGEVVLDMQHFER